MHHAQDSRLRTPWASTCEVQISLGQEGFHDYLLMQVVSVLACNSQLGADCIYGSSTATVPVPNSTAPTFHDIFSMPSTASVAIIKACVEFCLTTLPGPWNQVVDFLLVLFCIFSSASCIFQGSSASCLFSATITSHFALTLFSFFCFGNLVFFQPSLLLLLVSIKIIN